MADAWAKDWDDLNAEESAAATALGYSEHAWIARDEASPEACCMTWDLLSETQQRAARTLGYDQARWDLEYEGPQLTADEELWQAAEASDAEAVLRAIARNPVLNAWHGSQFCEQTTLHLSCGGGDVEVVRVLLEARADVNATDCEGATPLHRASFQGHVEVAKALLEAGANVEAKDTFGTSVMDKARGGGSDDVLALLEAAAPATMREDDTTSFDGNILSAEGRLVVVFAVSAALVAAVWTVRRRL